MVYLLLAAHQLLSFMLFQQFPSTAYIHLYPVYKLHVFSRARWMSMHILGLGNQVPATWQSDDVSGSTASFVCRCGIHHNSLVNA
jgi:hypothetical protein